MRFLNGQAAGHPLLLTATAEFLSARGWRYEEEEVDALLRGDHTQTILPEVVNRLTRTLGDLLREFLYRLTLPIGAFDQSDMSALAAVAPPVNRPRERLNELLGAWVQRDTDTKFIVSPLAKSIGRSELAADVRIRCYRELANVITRKGVINPVEGERAIFYNLEAGESGRATTLYVLLLVEVLRTKRADHDVIPYIDKWRDTRLPADLNVGNRLFVRAYQLAAFTKYGLDTGFVVREVDHLLTEATDSDGWGIVALAGQNLSQFRKQDPARVLRYIRRAVELPTIFGPDGREIILDKVFVPEMLWMLVTDLRTPALLRQWLDAVEAVPERHQAQFWGSKVARHGVWLVPNRSYTAEWEKPKQKQDWKALLIESDKSKVRIDS